MNRLEEQDFHLYKDISKRTGGEIYIGVVGPVRTGKSTFIKQFMDKIVLPNMENNQAKSEALDALPQSSGGRMITTTEPKFIPKQAAVVHLEQGVEMKIRLIDCVGFMVEGAMGHMENDVERMVKTPWSEEEIPFTKAAEIGTSKVIRDHSTIGIVVTTDASFGEIPREAYVPAEKRTMEELKELGKPFIVLLNTTKPYSPDVKALAQSLESQYQVKVLPVNMEQLKQDDITEILEHVMYEFPISKINIFTPKWFDMLELSHPLKKKIISALKDKVSEIRNIRNLWEDANLITCEDVKKCKLDQISLADGSAAYQLELDDSYYYQLLSDITGENITCEYELLDCLQRMAKQKKAYENVESALMSVKQKGYGVVTPKKEEIEIESPTLMKHGNKFGVRIKASSPSIHMIKANIETEIAPIVGSEEQAKDLIQYISDTRESDAGIWDTNIFGKTIEQLIQDGINGKIAMVGDKMQEKLQDSMEKIVNDTNGGMVCIII